MSNIFFHSYLFSFNSLITLMKLIHRSSLASSKNILSNLLFKEKNVYYGNFSPSSELKKTTNQKIITLDDRDEHVF